MVWSAILYKEKLSLAGVDGEMDSEYYVDLSVSSSIPSVNKLFGEQRAFHQEDAVNKSSDSTKSFSAKSTEVSDWLEKSSGLI